MESSVQVVLEQVNGNASRAQAEPGLETQVTLSSAIPLEEGEEAEDSAPAHPGDEE
jgi:hypothetical protein